MTSWLDLVAGLSFLGLAAATARTSRHMAVVSALAGVAWFLADVTPVALLIHRPLQLHAAQGFPDGRVRGRFAGVLLAASWAGALIQPLGRDAAFMLSLGSLIFVQSIRLRGQVRPGRRTEAATASRAVAVVALGLMLPSAGRLWAPTRIMGHGRGLAVYSALMALTALTLLTGVVARAATGRADEVIELSEITPSLTLRALRAELAAQDRSASIEPLRAAVQLLEANAELQATLTRNADEVRDSRRRLVDAAIAERKRIEDILAAGARTYLDELSWTLRTLHDGVDEATKTLIRTGLDEVEHSRDELEQLARGLHPRALVQHGLRAALTDLAERCPVPLTVHAPAARYREAIETALWYACTEALANIVKHAGATRATIELRSTAGGLVADIRDDGLGGATVTPGGGLAGLVDRLTAVDGVVSVEPNVGGGTHIEIRLPLQ
jgi:signal transduction histidine kinase